MASELSFSGGACDGHNHAWGDETPPLHHPGSCSPRGGAYDWNGTGTRSTASGIVNQWLYTWVLYGGDGIATHCNSCGRRCRARCE
jgi:hypothetical protein